MARRAVRNIILAFFAVTIASGITMARASESSFDGILQIHYIDPAAGKGSPSAEFVLEMAGGAEKTVVPLAGAFGASPPRSFNRQAVSVTGVESDTGVIHASRITKSGAGDSVEPAVTGPRPYAVLLCKFSDHPAETNPPSYYTGLMGAAYPGSNHVWPANSYNLMNVTGSAVFGWFTLPQPRSFYTIPGVPDFDRFKLFDDCTAVADSSVNFALFEGVNIMFNADANAAVGGGRTRLLDGVNRTWPATWEPNWGHTTGLLAHEMGHSIGLPHSASPYTGNPSWPYDSDWDMMSGGVCNGLGSSLGCVSTGTIAFHRDIQGWIPPGRKLIATLGSSTIIRMWPLSDPAPTGSQYQMAQIPVFGQPATQFYTVELRRKRGGYDDSTPSEGVLIHHVDTTRGDGDARVIDVDGNGNANDAAAIWTPGEVWMDTNGALVEVLQSFADGSMDVRIGYRSPGAIIAQSSGSTTVTEAGGTDTYTVTLTSPPAANVTVTASGAGQVTTAPGSLTFTPANWNVSQQLTVSAVNDSTPEPSPHNATITHAVTSSDLSYDGLPIGTVPVSITDNDGAVVITQSGGTTSVTEGGITDSYTVALAGPPSANVTITITNPSSDITLSAASLVFTPANWNVLQTVIVSAVDDAVDETSPENVTITHSSASGDVGYNGIPVPSVPVSVIDNDLAGVTVTQSGGATSVTEGGVTDSYSIVLASQPTANVTVNATFTAGDFTLSSSSLVFTPANWNVAQTITVTAVNDAVDEASPEVIAISHSIATGDPIYAGVPVAGVSVSVIDDDVAGVVVTQSDGTTAVTEGGATDSYSVVLTSQPTQTVTVNASFTVGDFTLSSSSLVFTSANWNVPQTVTVTAVNDARDEASPEVFLVSHTAASADPLYGGIPVAGVSVSVIDNDVAGFTINQTGGTTSVTEGGATDFYGVALTSEPAANVTVNISFTAGDITLSTSSLTFTPANWSTFQNVTVTAVNDFVDEPSPEIVVVTHSAVSSDGMYNGLPVPGVSVSVVDNDVAGVSVVQSGGTTVVTEGGASDSYTVVLTSQPLANVTVNASFVAGQITLSASSLSFTPGNWNTPQSITVTAVNDFIDEQSPMTVVVSHSSVSSDPLYSGIPVASVNVSVIDNDTAGVTLAHTGGSTEVTEGGAGDTFTVVLTSQPTAGVTVNLQGASPQLTLSVSSLSFNAGNWNVVQSVTVNAVDDPTEEPDPHTVNLSASVGSADPFYNGIPVTPLTVSIRDNDDQTRPGSEWLHSNNSIFLGGTPVLGRSSDNRSGIESVEIELSPLAGTARRENAQITSCDALRRLCNWQLNLSVLQVPGIYRLTARARDLKGNVETPGASITVVIV